MKKLIRELFNCIGQHRVLFIALVLLSLFVSFISLYIPLLVADTIDFIVDKNNVNIEKVSFYLMIIAIFSVICFLCQYLYDFLNSRMTILITHDLRDRYIKKINSVSMRYLDKNTKGDLISRLINDVELIGEGLLLGTTHILNSIFTIIFLILFILKINIKVGLVVIILAPISFALSKIIAKRTHKYYKSQMKSIGEESSFINETISNYKNNLLFNLKDRDIIKFNELEGKLNENAINATFYSSIVNPITRLINNVVYSVIALIGGYNVIFGVLTIGGFTAFLNYATQFAKPFNEIANVYTELQNAVAASERVNEVLRYVDESSFELDELKVKQGEINISNVNFSYDSKVNTLEGLNINIPAGSKVAIVGESGAGKTTIINLLLRFYEMNKGKITIDGNNIRNVTKTSLRKNIGVVLQEPWLLDGTIMENITLSKKDIDYEKVIDASKKSRIYDFVMRLPNEFDTVINNESTVLSEGEKQMICITRILYQDPKIIILDEATSNIDPRTELMTQLFLDDVMKDRTRIIIAHRLFTVFNADKIFVIDNKKIVEEGTHAELIAKEGVYYNLYRSQYQL